jgi:hypothetical protein
MAAGDSPMRTKQAAGRTEVIGAGDMLYTAGNFTMAASLCWQNRFLIYREKEGRKVWQ